MNWMANLSLWHVTLFNLPIASIISLEMLRQALGTFGYPAVILFIMVESMGIPFPGETMLLLASFYAAVDQKLQIPFVIACAAIGAIVGDNIGFYIGLKGGRPFITRFGRYFFVKPHHLDYAEDFFAKHGSKTVFFGRFIAILRTWAAFLAGVNHMDWRIFLIYNATGGILWAAIYGSLGYIAGRVLHDNFGQVEQIASQISWIGLAIVAVVIIGAFVVWRVRRARHSHQTEDKQAEKATSTK